jgi:hypothetical protein
MAANTSESQKRKRKMDEPESVPLSAVGKWVAWSSDGLRIVAVAEELNEAYRLAAEAGEADPMLERPGPRHRL